MGRAVLLMAHGAPASLEKVEEYVLHIRGGRPLAPELMATIQDRYRQVGGSPLLQLTFRQAEALREKLKNLDPNFGQVYVGMRHSPPFIHETIEHMKSDRVETLVAICMAPQFSNLTVGAYKKALDDAIQTQPLKYSLVTSFARHPQLIEAFTQQLKPALDRNPDTFVIFTAHSLPVRVLQEGDPYDYEVKETARMVANAVNLKDWRFAYQSQGMTSEAWLGPTVESVIDALASRNVSRIVVVPIGFVCDHVEILYEVDVQYKNYASQKGIELSRTASLNDSPAFIELLSTLVRERL